MSGGVTPDIRQNYSCGHIVFNAIHACMENSNQSQPYKLSNPVLYCAMKKE